MNPPDMGVGYQIFRDGELAHHLSRGEENAIALVYFFNSLEDFGVHTQDLVVILDDPISSFDSNFYYNSIAYISGYAEKFCQLFLFTHKFSVYKDCSLIFEGDDTNGYVLKRECGKPIMLNESDLISKYQDEYVYIFSQIYKFTKRPPSDVKDYFYFPNMARRLLEGFLTFKIPGNSDSLSKIKRLKGHDATQEAAALRLLNNKSHLKIIAKMDGADDFEGLEQLPKMLGDVLDFIKANDLIHFQSVEDICKNYFDIEEPGLMPETVLKVVPFYTTYPAAAGSGTILSDEELPFDEIGATNNRCDFVIKITGDSMQPHIMNDSLAMIRRTPVVEHNQIGIFVVDGESFCKKLVKTPQGKILLTSLNQEYPPIDVTEKEVWTWGEYVGELKI